jgi:hypothetical protein
VFEGVYGEVREMGEVLHCRGRVNMSSVALSWLSGLGSNEQPMLTPTLSHVHPYTVPSISLTQVVSTPATHLYRNVYHRRFEEGIRATLDVRSAQSTATYFVACWLCHTPYGI